MADDIKTDLQKLDEQAQAGVTDAAEDVSAAETWVKAHWVWIAAIGGVITGFVIAHFAHW